jgi:hypothetical protein
MSKVRLIVGMLVALTVPLVCATPASASPEVVATHAQNTVKGAQSAAPMSPAALYYENTRLEYLTDTPNTSTVVCFAQDLNLPAGTYTWRLYFNGPEDLAWSISVKGGNYVWQDCLRGTASGDYVQSTSLINAQGGVTSRGGYEFGISESEEYIFGSLLTSR